MPFPSETSIFWLAISWLAVWRITSLLCYEAGPFALMRRLRKYLKEGGYPKLLTCFHCTSLWISLIVVLAVFELRWMSILVALGIGGATSITERFLGGPAIEGDENYE